jgi:predicted nucleic acid-binding protein
MDGKPDKVILDTNVLVAAGFNPHSSSAKIIASIRAGKTTLVWNRSTQAESKAIIEQIPPLVWKQFSNLFSPEWEFQGETHLENFIEIEDPDDRKFAALAAATQATLISNDEHLLSVRNQLKIRILTPKEALQTGDF